MWRLVVVEAAGCRHSCGEQLRARLDHRLARRISRCQYRQRPAGYDQHDAGQSISGGRGPSPSVRRLHVCQAGFVADCARFAIQAGGALPLPSGAATAANQSTIITALGSPLQHPVHWRPLPIRSLSRDLLRVSSLYPIQSQYSYP